MYTIFSCLCLFGLISNSSLMEVGSVSREKLCAEQIAVIKNSSREGTLRVLSFNVLNANFDHVTPEKDQWVHRKAKVIEYVRFANPDLIGFQEVNALQLEDLEKELADTYACAASEPREKDGEIEPIFYRKDRLELVAAKTMKAVHNVFLVCQFADTVSGKSFYHLNCHLTFNNKEARQQEADGIAQWVQESTSDSAVLATGDFNTFPFHVNQNYPAYDGSWLIAKFCSVGLRDSFRTGILGHYGAVTTMNFNVQRQVTFAHDYTDAGAMLDHIFIKGPVQAFWTLSDPALVDGRFPSDHFPFMGEYGLL